MTVSGYRVSFGGDDNVLKLYSGGSRTVQYTKKCQIVHLEKLIVW